MASPKDKEEKKKVKIIGNDFSVCNMFKYRKDYALLLNDIYSEPDLVVFTGGADVNPALYLEKPIPETHFDEKRDAQDLAAFEKYLNKPKIGICRGGQFLNVMSGGQMWQHVDNHGRSHEVINLLDIGARWSAGDEISVTSTHHQMMIAGSSGEVLAIATDKTGLYGQANIYKSGSTVKRERPNWDTEVVWYEDTQSLCYQPHPEYVRNSNNEKYFFDLMDYFFWDKA